MKHHLIGLAGKARSGKDTVAKRLKSHHGFLPTSFAQPVKLAAQAMFGLTDEEAFSDEMKEQVNAFWGIKHRVMFQKIGTEGGRDLFGEDLWLKRWLRGYMDLRENSSVVVTDVRFENEAAMIREMGGRIFHIHRPGAGLEGHAGTHASEAGVNWAMGDIVIENTGSLSDLYEMVDQYARALLIAPGGPVEPL